MAAGDTLDRIGLRHEANLVDRCLRKYASVTFSFPYEHIQKTREELSEHKTPEEIKIDQRIKDIGTEWAQLDKNKSTAEKFKNEDKIKEYEEKMSDLSREINELQEKKYDLEETSEYSKKIQEHLPEVNYANDNAAAVLRSLGYAGDPYGVLDVHDLLRRITALRNSSKKQKEMQKHTREPEDSKEPGRVRVISPEFSASDIMDRVKRLEDLAKKALEKGISEIHYG